MFPRFSRRKTEGTLKTEQRRKKLRKEKSTTIFFKKMGNRLQFFMPREPKKKHNGQATKSTGRMPWHWEPMKDVVSCDKLRGAANRL